MPQVLSPLHPPPPWYVVHCQPLKEWYTAAVLTDQLGLTVYLPTVLQPFRGTLQRAPLFPRYLFVQANLEAVAPSTINAAPGVVRLVAFEEVPQPVPAATMAALRRRVDQLNTQGGLPVHGFQPGDAVWLTGGPLQGLEAVFVGPLKPRERVRVLIEFLGQLREAEVQVALLEPVRAAPAPQRARRTRGKGRRIKHA